MLDEAVFDLAAKGFVVARTADLATMTDEVRQAQAQLAARGIRGGPGIFQFCEIAKQHVAIHCEFARTEILRACESHHVSFGESLAQDLVEGFNRLTDREVELMENQLRDPMLPHNTGPASTSALHTVATQALAQGRAAAITEFEHFSIRLKNAAIRISRTAMPYAKDQRRNVLLVVADYLATTNNPIYTTQVRERLGFESTIDNERRVGNALAYWIKRGALEGKQIQALDQEFPYIVVTGITPSGTHIAEGDENASPALVSNIWHVQGDALIANAGYVAGDVTQNIGPPLAELANALDQLRSELQDSEDASAVAVDTMGEKAAALARAPEAQRSGLIKLLGSLAQIVQTLGATPQAWQLVALEMSKLGLNVPGPPTPPLQ